MAKTATFTTARGANITITHVTERVETVSLDGHAHERTTRCNDLTFSVNGKPVAGKRVVHPVEGVAVEIAMGSRQEGGKTIVMSAVAPVPADRLAEVDALFSAHVAEEAARAARAADAIKADSAYVANYRKIAAA